MYYATGNGGNGTEVYAFRSKKERDYFVAWDDRFDQRRVVDKGQARRYRATATLLVDGEMIPDGYGPTTVKL